MTQQTEAKRKAMSIHRACVATSSYYAARKILQLLIFGKVKLYLGDTDWEATSLLALSGFVSCVSSSGRSETFFLRTKGE